MSNMEKRYDVIIVGTGVAGCFAALHLPEDCRILMITKAGLEESDSFLAQGGICVLKTFEDYDSFFEDTMRAGHYENRKESVNVMIRSSREVIRELIGYGVEFSSEDGRLLYTREGAHATNRILYHEDITGQEITGKLLEQVQKLSNVTMQTETTMIDILCRNNRCEGVLLRDSAGELQPLFAGDVIWACGGIGGIYENSTNYPHLTGDALAIALRRGIRLCNINYVQIHPTTLYTEKPGRRFLISESVRGEGALLFDRPGGSRFVDELLPRDVLTEKIREQMEQDQSKCVWLSMENIPKETILEHFPNIYRKCLEEGYDVSMEPIPVIPSQHYFMGGVDVDLQSKTSMEHLYAAGETSCNGVHGANRLASNSLLESLVFAKRAAFAIAEGKNNRDTTNKIPDTWDALKEQYGIQTEDYKDMNEYAKICKEQIWSEIKKEEQHESHYDKIKR